MKRLIVWIGIAVGCVLLYLGHTQAQAARQPESTCQMRVEIHDGGQVFEVRRVLDAADGKADTQITHKGANGSKKGGAP